MTARTEQSIIISSDPKGVITEGIVTGTLKPGTALSLDVSEAVNNGRYTYEVATGGANGARSGGLIILLEDSVQGKLISTAYATGARCRVFYPAPGDEFLALVKDTQDTVVLGDLLIVENASGLFLETTGTPENEPAQALEALGTIAADTLCHAVATGQ